MSTHLTDLERYSHARYVYYKSNSDFEKEEALRLIDSMPIEVKRLFNSVRKRKERLRKKLSILFDEESSLYFLTLTFDDIYIDDHEFIIKHLIKRLKDENVRFIINEDYGVDDNFTHRVHYHCILNKRLKVVDYWNYGVFKNKKIRINETSLRILPDYLNKLVNHALKPSNKRLKVYCNI